MKSGRGNALFLVLIAVALFAALSYAITNSSRGSAGIDRETEQLDQAVTEQCTAAVEYGLNKLKILSNCSTDQISYELADGTNENPLNENDTSCFVFHSDGAGITPCGAYLDPTVLTGQIAAAGDTTTIVLTPAGLYFRCLSWSTINCTPRFSSDGVNFINNNQLCIYKGDGSDNTRGLGASSFVGPFATSLCQAACSSTSQGNFRQSAGSVEFYVEDDYSITPYTGVCDRTLRDFRCNCW